jgi:hypothetical protein
VKADAKFPGRYSEPERRAIVCEIDRITVGPGPAHSYQWVLTELERLAREYVAATVSSLAPRLPGERQRLTTERRFLEALHNQIVSVGRTIAKSGELRPSLYHVEALVSEIDRVLADKIDTASVFHDLMTKVSKASRKLNKKRSLEHATKAALDIYFGALQNFWMRIGGAKKRPGRHTRALLVSFIQACASPVVTDKKSVTRDAIAARLRRLENNR